jgi:hypothetical protein
MRISPKLVGISRMPVGVGEVGCREGWSVTESLRRVTAHYQYFAHDHLDHIGSGGQMGTDTWTVAEAKAKFSEVFDRAQSNVSKARRVCGTKRNDRVARRVFIRKKSHRQAITAGYTFSDCNISLAYCRHTAMSSCVIPGVVPQNVCFSPALSQQAHYEIHSQPAAPDNQLSSQHRRIKGYAVSPVHFMSLSAI